MSQSLSTSDNTNDGHDLGINFEFAKALYEKGCSVVLADLALRPESQEFVDAVSKRPDGAKAVFHRTDVTDWNQLEEVFDVAERVCGAVPTVVCPGAGIYEPVCTCREHPANYYRVLPLSGGITNSEISC